MKHIINVFLVAVCAATLLCSCSKAKTIYTTDNKVTFAINGGEKSIGVTADGGFDINDCPEWLKAEKNDTTIIFTAEANNTGAPRECVINLVGDNITVPVTITQADKCTHIYVTPAEVNLPKEGGEQVLSVDTDGANLNIESSAGINATLNGDKITVTAPANNAGTIRGSLTLTCDTVTAVVNVTIEGSICQRCNGSGKVRCTKCGGRGYVDDPTDLRGRYGCSKCGGRGYDYLGTIMPGVRDWIGDMRKGSGKMTCPDCGGAGH